MSSQPPPTEPLRLTDADFDTYLPERAGSDAFNAPRLELKERLLAWAHGVVDRLAEIDVHVDVTASDERPTLRNGRRVDAQRVVFWQGAQGEQNTQNTHSGENAHGAREAKTAQNVADAARAKLARIAEKKRTRAAIEGRDASRATPYERHAYLELRIDSSHVQVTVEVHPRASLDARNLRSRLSDPEATLELTSALEALPEQFVLGIAADGVSTRSTPATPASEATSETIRALLDRSEGEDRALWIGWSIPRDVAVKHSALLDDQLEDAIVALGSIFRLIAWTRDNDFVAGAPEKTPSQARLYAADTDDDALRDRHESDAKRKRAGGDDRSRRDEERESLPPSVSASGRAEAPPPAMEEPANAPNAKINARRLARPPLRTLVRRASPRGLAEVDPSLPVEKGSRVRVLAGPFVGKEGLVHELDGKGFARVMLGLLATRLDVKDLAVVVEPKDRPALTSSHRKPLPARS